MTRQELLDKLVRAIAQMEGFFSAQPTLAQRNANPGNLRAWRDAKGRSYPTSGGYVDFVAWASERFPGASREEMSRRALEEGWRILRVLAGQYIDGRYTGGKPPTVAEMFRTYAPASDGNDPAGYARFVAAKLGVQPDRRLIDLVTA
ncbi:MAG: hypothetical protein IT167_29635 [Bryobacterales bacterium]|nr:hypothetical protein [Bryobacterales bacterium]